MINQASYNYKICYFFVYIIILQRQMCGRCSLTNEGNSYMLFMTSKKTVDRGQAQSDTTSKCQTAVNTLIDTFMKQLRQDGIIIVVISGIRSRYYCGQQWNKEPMCQQQRRGDERNSISPKKDYYYDQAVTYGY